MPVALTCVVAVLPVVNGSAVKSVADLIALAKSKPNSLNYGSGGPGSMHHLSTELLLSLTGIQMTHVPYKATPPAMNDLLAGHIQVLFGDTTSVLPFIRQGAVRPLGVTTAKRSPARRPVRRSADFVAGLRVGVVADAGGAGRDAARGDRAAQPRGSHDLQRSRRDRRADQARRRPGAHRKSRGGAGFRQGGDRALGRRGAPRRPPRAASDRNASR